MGFINESSIRWLFDGIYELRTIHMLLVECSINEYVTTSFADELCFGIANGRVLNFGALCTQKTKVICYNLANILMSEEEFPYATDL